MYYSVATYRYILFADSFIPIFLQNTYCEHVVALLILDVIFFLNVKFAKEVESYNRINVDDYGQQHHRQDQL